MLQLQAGRQGGKDPPLFLSHEKIIWFFKEMKIFKYFKMPLKMPALSTA